MKTWELRPQEVANLLNPAFCGRILYQCVQAHESEGSAPLPYPLTFLVLPLVLHSSTRKTMQGNIRHFQVWLNNNQPVKLGLAERARSLVPYSLEALTFLLQVGVVAIDEGNASLRAIRDLRRARRGASAPSEETKECLSKATVLGKWFARTNSTTTIYAALGLMP